MTSDFDSIAEYTQSLLNNWVQSCTRTKQVARNTVAVGIVVLDHLRQQCPTRRHDILSEGGEIRGSRGKSLRATLEKYGIDPKYLKEVTTRQAHQDAQRLLESLDWGTILSALPDADRDLVLQQVIGSLVDLAQERLRRRNLKLDIDRSHAPAAWIHLILDGAKQRSEGIVEQHLVGAKLARRFQAIPIPNYPAHAGDEQTGRPGDFEIETTVFHVTASPTRAVIQKCAQNIAAGRHPVLLVPSPKQATAAALAEDEGVGSQISIVSIEDFVALNIIETAGGQTTDFFAVLQGIVQTYNERLEEVETDLSLRIEVS